MKLIDGHAMIQRVEALHKRGTVDLSYYNIVKEAVQMEPSVDAAPVVLCRDCIHWQEPFDSNNTGYLVAHCDMFKDGDAFHEQFYCAHGERRDSNGKNT